MLIQNDKKIANENKNNIIKHLNKSAKAVKISLPIIKVKLKSGVSILPLLGQRTGMYIKFLYESLSTCFVDIALKADRNKKSSMIKKAKAVLNLTTLVGLFGLAYIDLPFISVPKILPWINALTLFPLLSTEKTIKQVFYNTDKFIRVWQNCGMKNDIETGRGYPILERKYKDEDGNTIYDFDMNYNSNKSLTGKTELFESCVQQKVTRVNDNVPGHLIITCRNYIEIPAFVQFKANKHISENRDEIILGVADGRLFKVNIRDNPHTLIAGITRGGKSVLQNYIVEQFLAKGFEVYGIDMKDGLALQIFKDSMHIAEKRTDALNLIDKIRENLQDRSNILKQHGCENIYQLKEETGIELTEVVLVIDELAELLNEADKDLTKKITDKLISLSKLGAAWGLKLLVATQRPSATVINPEFRSQIKNKISTFQSDAGTSKIAINSEAACHLNSKIKGRFVMFDDREIVEFQVPFFDKHCHVERQAITSNLQADDKNEQALIISDTSTKSTNYDLLKKVTVEDYFLKLKDMQAQAGKIYSYRKMAEELHISQNTAYQLFTQLKNDGYLSVDENKEIIINDKEFVNNSTK